MDHGYSPRSRATLACRFQMAFHVVFSCTSSGSPFLFTDSSHVQPVASDGDEGRNSLWLPASATEGTKVERLPKL